jgi:hypothetical protein
LTDRNKPGVAFWATVVLVGLPLLYVLSFGPACWMVDGGMVAARPVARIYRPIVIVVAKSQWRAPYRIAKAYAGIGGIHPRWTLRRLEDANGLIQMKAGFWPKGSTMHDVPYRFRDEGPD